MAKVTSRTIRVTDIPLDVNEKDFLKYAQHLGSKSIDRGLFSSTVQGNPSPTITFSPQFDGHIGTITLPSEKHKIVALKNNNTQWRLDDIFNGVTILFCPKEPDLEYVNQALPLEMENSKSKYSICAVHGLNGNAFDTWVAESNNRTTMWLRDLLPTSMPFDKARIMTFGYSSQLSDRRNLSGINEWSHHLLECLSNVRLSEEVNYLGRWLKRRKLTMGLQGEKSANLVCLSLLRWTRSSSGVCFLPMTTLAKRVLLLRYYIIIGYDSIE